MAAHASPPRGVRHRPTRAETPRQRPDEDSELDTPLTPLDLEGPDNAESAIEGSASYSGGGRIHGSVVRAIGSMILSGRFAPEETLPREGELAIQLGVSRTSVREAVKVLSAKGLIEARPRVGLRVRPRDDWNMLDPAVLSWHPNLTADSDLMGSLIETRRIIEPRAAGLAARRGTAAELAAIEAAFIAMERAFPDDLAGYVDADVAFHRAVMTASHNMVLKGLIGTIEAALRAVFHVTNRDRLTERESEPLVAHGQVLDRIRFRDEAGAIAAMNVILDVAAHDVASWEDAEHA